MVATQPVKKYARSPRGTGNQKHYFGIAELAAPTPLKELPGRDSVPALISPSHSSRTPSIVDWQKALRRISRLAGSHGPPKHKSGRETLGRRFDYCGDSAQPLGGVPPGRDEWLRPIGLD